MILKNNSGFTLAEVVITLGISSAVILGASGFFKTTSDSNVSTNNRIDKTEYFDEMAKTISNRLTCAETLQNLTVGSSVPSIKKKGKALYSTGQSLSKYATLNSIKLEQNSNWTPVAEKYGPARLKIEVTANGATVTKYFPISIQLDKNKKVVGCSQKLELASVKEEIYEDVCTDVVGGSLNSSKCYWTKPIRIEYYYVPAPAPVADTSGGGNTCYGPICDMYLSQLGRYPDAGGKAYWEEQVATGSSLSQISSGIAASTEANGGTWGAAEWSNYAADVANRGMTFDYAVKQCGRDMSC